MNILNKWKYRLRKPTSRYNLKVFPIHTINAYAGKFNIKCSRCNGIGIVWSPYSFISAMFNDVEVCNTCFGAIIPTVPISELNNEQS